MTTKDIKEVEQIMKQHECGCEVCATTTKLCPATSSSYALHLYEQHKRISTLEAAIAYVKEHVTVEIAAHGDCQCLTGIPCVYCASIKFNEALTTPTSTAESDFVTCDKCGKNLPYPLGTKNVTCKECSAERTDGERLDWLENECENIVPYSTGGPFPKHAHWKVAAYNGNFENESLRAAIDAALDKSRTKRKK